MIKKYAVVFSLFLISSLLFAEVIRPAHRYFEIGIAAEAGLSNNSLTAKDLLKKELIIDLNKLADDMPKKGLSFDADADLSLFMNLNLKNDVHAGLNIGTDVTGNVTVSRGIFDFLGHGNELGEKIRSGGEIYGDVFAYVTTSAGFKINRILFKVSPSIFTPLFHMESSGMKASFVNCPSGSIKATLASDIKIYSYTDISPLLDKNSGSSFEPANMSGTKFGFDMEIRAELPVFRTLQCGGYMRIPIVPGRMDNMMTATFSTEYESENMKSLLQNDSANNSGYNISDMTFGKEEIRLNRPFRTGGEIMWRPFGNWMSFGALLGFGVRYPFSNSAKAYIDYDFSMDISLFKILGVSFATVRYDEIFAQRFGFMLNARVIEIDLGVEFRGADFVNSIKGSGAGAFVKFSTGF